MDETLPGMDSWGSAGASDGALVEAAERTIASLREQGVIQGWHELDCAIVLEAARGVRTSRGVARSQMLTALLQARAKLPTPTIRETAEVVELEGERIARFLAEYEDDPAAFDVAASQQLTSA